MDIYRLLKVAQKLAMNVVRATYKNTLIAKWETTPVAAGQWNDNTGRYEDLAGNAIPNDKHELDIPALFDEAPNLIYKYAKYGVNPQTDIIAVIPDDFVLPDTTAIYYRNGDPTAYKLKNIIKRADIGVAPGIEGAKSTAMPETAYKVLHLTSGNISS